MAQAIGTFWGWIWYYIIPVRRGVALDNLKKALPDLSAAERKRIVRSNLVHLSKSVVELLRISRLSKKRTMKLVDFEGLSILRRALEERQGAVVVTAHFGNFDLLAVAACLQGIPLHILTRTQKNKGVNNFWMKARARYGVNFIAPKNSVYKMHKVLRSGQALAMVIDQHMPQGRGITVEFFGRPASTTHAPALMAIVAKAPIIPVTIERLPNGFHRAVIEEEIRIDFENKREEEVIVVTKKLNQWLEEKIKKRPDHWLWIHRRWKLNTGDNDKKRP